MPTVPTNHSPDQPEHQQPAEADQPAAPAHAAGEPAAGGGGARRTASRRRWLVGGAAALLPAAAAATALAGCDSSHHAAPAPPPPPLPSTSVLPTADHPGFVDVVRDFGAKGDGRTDDSAAFQAAYRYAASRIDNHVGRTVIDIPPGVFLIRQPNALLDGDQPKNRANGLRFRGAGLRMTELVFAPAAIGEGDGTGAGGAYLCSNDDMWANLSFEGIRFTSGTPGASFFYSYSTGGAANYRFDQCEWAGEWTYGLALDGSNTNSEMRWEACHVGGAYREAFLFSGLSDRSTNHQQQDQFLNYWFTDMNVTYEWGDFLNFPYGGSITCRAGSYIVTGRRPQPHPVYGYESAFFRFPRRQHFDSVQRFHAEDIRFELRGADTVVIDSSWGGGTIHFNDCDDTANGFKSFSPGMRSHRYAIGPTGPLVRYDSCQLAGTHQFQTPAGAPAPGVVRYDMCRFQNHPAAQFLAGAALPDGTVRMIDCLDAG